MNRRKIKIAADKITEEMALSEPGSRRLALTPQPELHQSSCPSLDFSPHAPLLLPLHKKQRVAGGGERRLSPMTKRV